MNKFKQMQSESSIIGAFIHSAYNNIFHSVMPNSSGIDTLLEHYLSENLIVDEEIRGAIADLKSSLQVAIKAHRDFSSILDDRIAQAQKEL